MEIHEFSTGINFQGTPENWYSQGLMGYMNSTLSTIPSAVQNAIADGLFTIPEEQIIRESVIIGREVDEGINPGWSMIAVVTQAEDDRGRIFNVYRYFLSEGLGQLEGILRWYILEAGKPKFNPFEIQEVDQPHIYDTNKRPKVGNLLNKPEFKQLLTINEYPLIISPQLKCVPLIVNELALQKKVGSELISWVYNVEKLTEPWKFGVIYPASENADKEIRNNLKNQPQDIPLRQEIETPQSSKNLSQNTLIPTTENSSNVSNSLPLTPVETEKNQDTSSTATITPSQLTLNSPKSPLFSSQKSSLIILSVSIIISLILGFILGRITDNKHQNLVTHLFDKVTIPALNDIVKYYNIYLDVDNRKTAETIVSIIQDDNTNISLNFFTKYKTNEQKKWIKAIENYQKNAKLEPTGIITKNDDTEKRLKCQIHKELKLSNNSEIIEECKKQGITLSTDNL